MISGGEDLTESGEWSLRLHRTYYVRFLSGSLPSGRRLHLRFHNQTYKLPQVLNVREFMEELEPCGRQAHGPLWFTFRVGLESV